MLRLKKLPHKVQVPDSINRPMKISERPNAKVLFDNIVDNAKPSRGLVWMIEQAMQGNPALLDELYAMIKSPEFAQAIIQNVTQHAFEHAAGAKMSNVAKIAKKLLDKGETKLAQEVLALDSDEEYTNLTEIKTQLTTMLQQIKDVEEAGAPLEDMHSLLDDIVQRCTQISALANLRS